LTGARKVPRSFYAREATVVARELLGHVLVRQDGDTVLRGKIVETEAYLGADDPGSHAYHGRTNRTLVMFGEAGHLYVYFTYGMHFCMNVVTGEEGVASAVLLRALEPLAGIDRMQARRGMRPVDQLCNGPAKLCQAFGITRDENGVDLETGGIWIEDEGTYPGEIATSTRVGIRAGRELQYRYYVSENPHVSPGKPS